MNKQEAIKLLNETAELVSTNTELMNALYMGVDALENIVIHDDKQHNLQPGDICECWNDEYVNRELMYFKEYDGTTPVFSPRSILARDNWSITYDHYHKIDLWHFAPENTKWLVRWPDNSKIVFVDDSCSGDPESTNRVEFGGDGIIERKAE
jgi:hypothetical protein